MHAKARQTLNVLATELQKSNLLCSTDVLSGNVYVETLAAAEKLNADLIIIGSGRPELKDYFLGPSAARVARHADCSVYGQGMKNEHSKNRLPKHFSYHHDQRRN